MHRGRCADRAAIISKVLAGQVSAVGIPSAVWPDGYAHRGLSSAVLQRGSWCPSLLGVIVLSEGAGVVLVCPSRPHLVAGRPAAGAHISALSRLRPFPRTARPHVV